MNNYIYDLNNKGYAIIPNVLSEEEIEEYIIEFNKWMDSIPNSDYLHNLIHFNGIFKYFQVGHQRFAWLLRTNEKILNIFKSIWNTNDLVVSFDGCNYFPKQSNQKESYWIHSDQSPTKSEFNCVQSFVSLTSNKEKTFIVYEGSHKLHKDHTDMYNLDNPSDWYPIKKEYIENIEHLKRTLDVSAGSMVLWDSRTFHQNTCGPENSTEERLVQYLCYFPKNHILNNEETQNLRKIYFNKLRTTNHFPYPIYPISLQPVTYNKIFNDNIYIDYSTLRKPYLEDISGKIMKLL